MSSWLSQILQADTTDQAWQDKAIETVLADTLRAKAFGITPENASQVIEARANLLKSVYPAFSQFCQTSLHQQPYQMLEPLWNLWLPMAMQLSFHRQQLDRPLIQGILGGQGTGKTTLAAILTLILQHLGYSTVSLSLDDLYKTYRDRLALREQDARLIWRGPPGTHDIELGLTVLNQVRQSSKPIEVPRFDKSAYNGAGDRGEPEVVENADILLFEGWFVGARPINPAAFDNPPPPILTAEDRTFARDMNGKLADYLPLWERLDRLIVMHPSDYRCSVQWRTEAEQKMIAAGKAGMTNSEIEQFVKYFWKALHPELFIQPLVKSSQWVDLVIEINPDRSIGKVYQPSEIN